MGGCVYVCGACVCVVFVLCLRLLYVRVRVFGCKLQGVLQL